MLGLYYNVIGEVHLGAAWWALASRSVSDRLFGAVQYWYVGDYVRAEREQENMVALGRRGARRLLAGIYLSQGKLLEARSQIEHALGDGLDTYVDHAAVLTTAALIEIFAGSWNAARAHLETAMGLDPPVHLIAHNGVVTTTLMAYVLNKQGDARQAAEMLQRSIELDTASLRRGLTYAAHHYYDLARVHAIRGNVSEANRRLREAIDNGWFFSYTYMGPRDPLLETLRGSLEFETRMTESRAELDRQRELMTEMEALSEEQLLTLLVEEVHEDLEELRPYSGP
jgi:tetratricopeptide (TPR) repeat protein